MSDFPDVDNSGIEKGRSGIEKGRVGLHLESGIGIGLTWPDISMSDHSDEC